jgi:hypothetical protein
MEEHKMKYTITLSDEQAAVLSESESQEYVRALANDRVIRKADRERSQKILVLAASSEKELSDAVAPIIAAEKLKAEKIEEKL